jgi:hypothetical protein
MAVSADRLPLSPDPKFGENAIVQWTLTDADTATEVSLAEYADRSVQVQGTFGGATITIQGSNDGTNWHTLNDFEGDALSFTSAGLRMIAEPTAYIKPVTAGGSSSSVVITIAGLRKRF